ncbi:hypothetical protein Moror_11031 [Moniliophthora roreri MCA 2997]|uniref:DUF6534 domain-containing protein n=1 Tax=Moniliophthora roreri (strain MCA 2997) TaxID=1381753 RepID=V2WUF7_MONRO|nr:hypothetical protein Moror_11031 [Moniliophthora roreri MCA 2997]
MPTFNETWGCQLLAFVFDLTLYGVALILVAQYFRSYCTGDNVMIRATVGLLCVISTVHIAFLSHQIYTDFVIWFNKPERLDHIPFSASAMLLAIHLTAFTAQMFFISRIWILAKKARFWYTAPVLILALLQVSLGIAQTIVVTETGLFSRLAITVLRIRSTQAASAAACDISITFVLCFLLNQGRSSSRRTNSMIDDMILYAINRGTATSVAALIQLLLFVGKPGTFFFMIFLLPICQLYVISVVSMLMSRQSLRDKLGAESEGATTFQLETFRAARNESSNLQSMSPADIITWRDNEDVLGKNT